MILRNCGTLGVILLVSATFGKTAMAQTNTQTSLTYPTGWTMVGAPPGTNFASVAPLYVWTGTTYVNPSSSVAALCQGYWALISVQTTVTLAQSTSAATQSCTLHSGWNLVGNPFDGPAILPYGSAGYAVNAVTGGYMQVPAIAPGGAVWIYEDSVATIVLQQAPTSHIPTTITISAVPSGPYSAHVGDVIQLFLPGTPPYTATADAATLHFDAAGSVTSLSCLGDPSCQFTTTRQYWSWHATNPGKAFINVAPICADGSLKCGVVTSIEIDVQP